MQGFFELLTAAALLIWVIGPLARWQYEKELLTPKCTADEDRDGLPSVERADDPLASHPYYRSTRVRRGTIL